MTRIKQIAAQPNAPKLSLRIKNGNSQHYNKMLEITPLGLVGAHRGAEDGNVYMGTLKHSMPDAKGKYTIMNDFVLPPFQLPQ